jgi:hypothetical protein
MADPAYRACLRKRKHATEELALAVGAHSEAESRKQGKRVSIRAYRCSRCQCWHLTHERKRKGRR